MRLRISAQGRTYTVALEAAADSQLADTIPRGRGLGTRSPPTGHTHLPSHQSVSSTDDG